MTVLDLAYFNYEHGGLIAPTSRGDEIRGYDYAGLVRVMGEDDRWPHLFVMGEGDCYDFFGGKGIGARPRRCATPVAELTSRCRARCRASGGRSHR